ncbi:hypothetical protein [Mycobacteroides chelonae]|uniref:hypothetical protein n=1 Tax=Mycobacteroides chelonae TaxID=1774 RepID=UPI0012FF7A35|nr:hypothetical protein [Mycobacteroides chelonae]
MRNGWVPDWYWYRFVDELAESIGARVVARVGDQVRIVTGYGNGWWMTYWPDLPEVQ